MKPFTLIGVEGFHSGRLFCIKWPFLIFKGNQFADGTKTKSNGSYLVTCHILVLTKNMSENLKIQAHNLVFVFQAVHAIEAREVRLPLPLLE